MNEYIISYTNGNISQGVTISCDDVAIVNNCIVFYTLGNIVAAYPADKTVVLKYGVAIKPNR